MIDAVLFDWGHTLMDWVWDERLLEAGIRTGLEAAGAPAVKAHEVTHRYRNEVRLTDWEVPEEVEYEGLVREMLADVGVSVDDAQLERYLVAEHAVWAPARRLAPMSHALLDSLRDHGLKTGLVSNAMDPGWLLRRDLDEQGLAGRLDSIVFSSEVGVRKPHPRIFQRALDELEVEPARALFVGDRLKQDVRGARDMGMRTVLALWFRVEDDVDEAEPDFRAFTHMDVLNVVRRLTRLGR
ncbi:MAG TPA: HAD family hydrolase [Gaiellaceae bacterium]|nr:HAD family hydrolase [Gaiellaceae bacterium]